ncbi:hypothetical protein KAT92_05945 [Candidatus Babeliales bacterium]|nr:hypothetical protein [Candidatus Babeliales bacterium]
MAKAKTKEKKYEIKMMFNGKVHKEKTDSLDKTIKGFAPAQMFSEMYVEARKGDMLSERRVTAVQARKIFADPIERQIFINNLLLN